MNNPPCKEHVIDIQNPYSLAPLPKLNPPPAISSTFWTPAPKALLPLGLPKAPPRSELALEFGPLPKTIATRLLECLIEALLSDIEDCELKYDETLGEYILNPFKTNISILIKKANLTHLQISSEHIKLFQKQAYKHSNANHEHHPLHPLIAQLEPGLQTALRLYTDSSDCNLFSYGKKCNLDGQQFNSLTAKRHLLTLCFGAVAINQLIKLYDYALFNISKKLQKYPEQLSLQEKKLLGFHLQHHQARNLSREDLMSWFVGDIGESRLTTIPGFVSTSYYKKGSANVRILNAPHFLPTIEAISAFTTEYEVLLPPGGHYIIQKQAVNSFDMTYVVSPSFNSPLSHAVSSALRYALRYLQQRYIDTPDVAVIGTYLIERPNHGLLHTLRQLYLVKPIMNYFAKHAKDLKFATFCHLEKELELILLGLIFAVTGRESEIAFSDDPNRYRTYREASARHVVQYTQWAKMDEHKTRRIHRLVLFLGNPDFPTKINTPGSAEYNEEDNFIFHIMTFAHKLDLPRCYTLYQWQNSLAIYTRQPLIDESQYFHDWHNLTRYALQLLSASHDYIMSDIAMVYGMQKKPMRDAFFAKLSLSPSDAESVLESVPSPALTTFSYGKKGCTFFDRKFSVDESTQTESQVHALVMGKTKYYSYV